MAEVRLSARSASARKRLSRGRAAGTRSEKTAVATGQSLSIAALDRLQSNQLQITSRDRSDSLAQEVFDYFRTEIESGRLKAEIVSPRIASSRANLASR
jgi:hypothetical protein